MFDLQDFHVKVHQSQSFQDLILRDLDYNKQYLLEWDVNPENIAFQAVKFLVYHFDSGEAHNIYKTSNILSLTGETQLEIPKKILQSGHSLMIIGVSKNNNLKVNNINSSFSFCIG